MPLAAAALTIAGVAILVWGTTKAAPLVFFGTAEERADMETGRHLMLLGTALLLGAAVVVGARAGLARAVVVASPGVLAVACAYAFPRTALAYVPALVLGLAAVVAALSLPRG
jgi:hypothetical protein